MAGSLDTTAERHLSSDRNVQRLAARRRDLVSLEAQSTCSAGDDIVYSSWRQEVSRNAQNIPGRGKWAKIRDCFIADTGCLLIDSDYSQFEVRALADGAGEKGMMEFFRRSNASEEALDRYLKDNPQVAEQIEVVTKHNKDLDKDDPRRLKITDLEYLRLEREKNENDFHYLNAVKLFGREFTEETNPKKKAEIRARAKGLSFGIPYGIGAKKIARQFKISDTEAQKMVDEFYRQWPAVKAYLAESKRSARLRKELVNAAGRKRFFHVPLSFQTTKSEKYRDPWEGHWSKLEREASNYNLQSINGDVLKMACILLDPLIRPYGARFVLFIHDELLVESPEEHTQTVLSIMSEKMVEAAILCGVNRCPISAAGLVSDHWVH